MANPNLQSVEALSEAILENPSEPVLYAGRAYSYCELRQYQKAIEDYDEVLRLIPNTQKNHAIALVNRGVLYAYLDEYQKAIEDYDEAIRTTRPTALFYFYRGTAYQQTGEHRKAIEDYNEAIRLGRGESEYHLGRGTSYRELGEDDLAEKDFYFSGQTGQLYDEETPITLIALQSSKQKDWGWVFLTWRPGMAFIIPGLTLLAVGWLWFGGAPSEVLWAAAGAAAVWSGIGYSVVWFIDTKLGTWDDEGSLVPGRISLTAFLCFLCLVGIVAEIVIWIFFQDRMSCWFPEDTSWCRRS